MKHTNQDRISNERIKDSRFKYKIVTMIIPLIAILVFWQRDQIIYIGTLLPPCQIYSIFDIYCPSCGNTRSVTALLKGDILSSLSYNIIPFILLLFIISAYTELLIYAFGKRIHILPRKPLFYILGGVFVAAYLISRNIV
ncbi:MAG TPA: DUF2752 domain-containing protein [Clostridiales bacterium]|nr:DUF2752 domain-containing protein [Clostridiales bacterium]